MDWRDRTLALTSGELGGQAMQVLRSVLGGAALALMLLPLPVMAEACLGNISRAPDGTAIRFATLKSEEVRISYIGHSTFTIESPGGSVAATDYNDYYRPPQTPTVATMNYAHSTHYSMNPDPGIQHVMRGWSLDGRMPKHDVQAGDMRVRNVPTNIRAGFGGPGGDTQYYGNSIFIFEAAGLCIAHLGHLHHTLTPEHLQAIGKIDIVLAAVDGSWTIDLAGIVEVLEQLKPKIIIPMHYLSERVLERFLDKMAGTYAIERVVSPSRVFSIAELPTKPTIMTLLGR
jgi:L-ascorbate metabolism protein UlaG (beta-lactamase superfamily)